MTSSLSPGGTVSASTSVKKPYLYSRFARSSMVFCAVVMAFLFGGGPCTPPGSSLAGARRPAPLLALGVSDGSGLTPPSGLREPRVVSHEPARYTENECPHPHVLFACGLFSVKPRLMRLVS